MNARMSNLAMKPSQTKGCKCANTGGGSCDCGGQCGCESRCCELECLVRPNFFCGQLLTDADLAAMVEWTRKRLALARYRDGWGIACGLDLSCSAPGGDASCCGEARSGPAVYLSAGYAIDCCGNDLVVCEPIRVDLSSVCLPPDDPCEPRATRVPVVPTVAVAAGRLDAAGEQVVVDQTSCLRVNRENLFAVQVSLRYHEDLAQGQRAMFRGGCSDVGSCEYSRVMERPCVYVEEIAMPKLEEDEQTEEQAWMLEFQKLVQRETASIQALLEKGLDAVLQFIKRNPPYQFCFLEEMVCCLRAQTALNGELSVDERTSVGLYLLVDRLLRHLQCPCPSYRPDNGVPLGRVLLRRSIVSGKTQCKVVVIDQTRPSRRLLRKDLCRPVSEGKVDLLRYFWQPAVLTRSRLGTLGVKLRPSDEGSVTRRVLETQSNVFEDQVLTYDLESGDQLIAHTATDYFGVERITAFKLARQT